MDYYQSNQPSSDDSGLSGGISVRFGNQIAARNTFIPQVTSRRTPNTQNVSQVFTIDICVDGEVKSLDVYVAGDPY
jgi:hypothetical protein